MNPTTRTCECGAELCGECKYTPKRELCEKCKYIPKRGICANCGLVKNHMYSYESTPLSIDMLYYNCYWCGQLMKNSQKNRREHGQKCINKFSPIQVCHCGNTCISCLKLTNHPMYYFECGCTYCSMCDLGYSLQPFMNGYCQSCSNLGFKKLVNETTKLYKNIVNAGWMEDQGQMEDQY
jgi:hypothetical protein